MSEMKIAILPESLDGHPADQDHPDRVIVNFEMDEYGGPAKPMKYTICSKATVSREVIEEVHRKLSDGAVIDELSNGHRFVHLRHIS